MIVYWDETQDEDPGEEHRHLFLGTVYADGCKHELDTALCGYGFHAGKPRSKRPYCATCLKLAHLIRDKAANR